MIASACILTLSKMPISLNLDEQIPEQNAPSISKVTKVCIHFFFYKIYQKKNRSIIQDLPNRPSEYSIFLVMTEIFTYRVENASSAPLSPYFPASHLPCQHPGTILFPRFLGSSSL